MTTITQLKKGSDVWLFEIIQPKYNHKPSLSPSAHAQIRNLYKDEVFKTRITNDRRVRISAKQTYTVLKLANPENPTILRDIYNKRQQIRRVELVRKTPISALLTALIKKRGYKDKFFTLYNTKYSVKDDYLTHLFIVYDKHIDLLIENSEVLVTDLTYKINRFNMSFVNIVRMTGMNRSFFSGSMFIPGEKEKDYKLAFFAIRKLYDVYELPYLKTFVTDTYIAETAAMEYIFFRVNHILCIWHINCNILIKLKPIIKEQFNSGDDDDNEDNSRLEVILRKTDQLAEFLNRKWKEFKRYQMKAIEAHTEDLWNTNQKQFRVKFEL